MWLTDNRDLWPTRGQVLDVACGRGRHALLLAQSGLHVRAIDRDPGAIAELRAEADRLGLPIETDVIDLETDPPPGLGASRYDMIVVINYLHRPLMPMIRAAVKPGGRVFYETFTTRQAERGKPRNPAFLLRDGELRELMAPLAILRSREGDIDGRFIASIVAEPQ
jgi:2-polyprenyl-3-methyl-5-hydroxy-6-metoxy-1,4-benzoquinol methylase